MAGRRAPGRRPTLVDVAAEAGVSLATASRALGYQQVLAALAGQCTMDEARAETVRATKRFARRQDSWFRRDPRVHWLKGGLADRAELPQLAMALIERPVTA